MSLKARLAVHFSLALIVFTSLLFIPAGSWKFWQGWVVLVIWFMPGLAAGIFFYKRDPELLERRMRAKEKVREQKLIMTCFYAIFLISFVLPGLDHRFGWSRPPLWLTLLGQVLLLASYLMTFWVVRVNRFASRTIQVDPGQTVISTGPYRIVRHPMYLGGSVMLLAMPLALGSYWALPAFALLIPALVLRLLNEEKILRQELPGYSAYCLRTRFRLVPFLW